MSITNTYGTTNPYTGYTGGTGGTGETGATDQSDTVSPGIQAMLATMPAPEAAIFKALLKTLEPTALAPDGKPGQEPTAEDLQRLAKVVNAIVAMSVSGDTMTFLARAMIQQQGQERHEAVQDRQNMRQLAMGQLIAAAGELNKQADTIETTAIVNLVMTCVGAALSMAGSFASMAKTSQAMGELEKAPQMANLLSKQGDAWSGVLGGAGKMFEAAGSFAGAEGQAEAKRSEADQKLDEAQAQNLESQADVKKGVQDGLDDMIKQIIALVKELQDAKAERMHAFTKV